MATFARQIRHRPRLLAAAGSLLFHAGLADVLIKQIDRSNSTYWEVARGGGEAGVTLTLSRDVSSGGAAAPTAAPRPTRSTADAPVQPAAAAAQPAVAVRPPAPTSAGAQGAAPAPFVLTSADVAAPTLERRGAATPAGEGEGPPPAIDPAAGADYRRRLLAHIQLFKRYPALGRRDRAAGTVDLAFELDRDGRLISVWVSRSSGSDLLDAAALDTLRRADPLPAIPFGLPDRLSVELPVEFSQANG